MLRHNFRVPLKSRYLTSLQWLPSTQSGLQLHSITPWSDVGGEASHAHRCARHLNYPALVGMGGVVTGGIGADASAPHTECDDNALPLIARQQHHPLSS